jgi:hypothetical protein
MTFNLTVVAIALHMLEINKVVKIASDFILFFFPNRCHDTDNKRLQEATEIEIQNYFK